MENQIIEQNLKLFKMSQEIRDTFIFYRSFYEMAKEMSDAERLTFFDAICEYALNFKEVELKGIAKICFIGAKPNISANTKRYQNGKLGAEHGIKGGRPKTPKKPLKNPTGDFENNPKETPNKNKDVNNNKDLECKSELEMEIIPKPKGSIKPTTEEIIIPNFIDAELWNGFLEMRIRAKAKPTDLAIRGILNKLEDFESKNRGWANNALQSSIENNWKGVFEPKKNYQSKPQSPLGWLNK